MILLKLTHHGTEAEQNLNRHLFGAAYGQRGMRNRLYRWLEEALSFQEVPTEAHAMLFGQTMGLDRGNMLRRCIALRLGEVIFGIQGIELDHMRVARHLGNNRGGGDAGNASIAMNNIAFMVYRPQWVSIHQHAVGRKPGIGDGACNGAAPTPCRCDRFQRPECGRTL